MIFSWESCVNNYYTRSHLCRDSSLTAQRFRTQERHLKWQVFDWQDPTERIDWSLISQSVHWGESVNQCTALCFRHESLSLQRELDGLSERYSQQCVELNRIQNSTEDRDGQIRQKERDMEQLRQENQVDRKWDERNEAVLNIFPEILYAIGWYTINMWSLNFNF